MRPVIFAFSTAFLPGTVLQKPHRYGKLQIRTEQEVCSVEIGNTNTLFCDLHTHSTCSDGTLTPEELVGLALERGLGAIALTDHNTVAGCARFAAAAAGKPIHAVCGAEFSTDFAGEELHLLGLFLPPLVFDEVTAFMAKRNAMKEDSNRQTIENLRAAGFDISYDELCAAFPGIFRNRSHIAQLLIRKGIVQSVNEAFRKLLDTDCGFYIRPHNPNFFKTIRQIKAWGGVAVWAHPLYHVDISKVYAILPSAAAAGLDGAEVYYSTYSDADTAAMLAAVKTYGILPSGGSDFHGSVKPDIALGTGRGNLAVPYSFYEALRAHAKN